MTEIRPWQWLTGLAVIGLALYPGTSRAREQCLPPPTTDAQCLECHQAKVDQELTKQYVHQPFREKKCILCHLGGELSTPKKTAYKSDQKITWLAESPLPSREHWFPLSKYQVNGDIRLDIMVPGRGVYRGVIESGDSSGLPEMTQDRTPPTLTDVKIAGIEKGALLSATVTWLTDELADTRISYGNKKLDTSNYIAEMTSSHQITIAPLKNATEYQFQVGSADYLGNLAQAAIATFSTSDAAGQPADQKLAVRSKEEPTWDHEIYQDRPAGTIILKITTTTPTKVAVGTPKEMQPEIDADLVTNPSRKPCRHQMKSALETTITICQPCHEAYFKGGKRHPLQVRPKAGMLFPPELFVLSNGGISCMTCHSAHSSNYPNRLVKSGKEELCRGCHTEKNNR
jgi:predicted CXXCH cytochrome family protein